MSGHFSVAGVDVGQLAEKCDRRQGVNSCLINWTIVLIEYGDIITMGIDD